MQEVWKEIEGFDGSYSISNFGRFRNNKTRVIFSGSPSSIVILRLSNQEFD